MKPYFYLLTILFLSNTAIRILQIIGGIPPVLLVSYLADIVLFALCLRACFALCFSRGYFNSQSLRLIYYGTLALGIISVLLRGSGESVGVPIMSHHVLDLAMWFLSYILFAVPVILRELDIKKKESSRT